MATRPVVPDSYNASFEAWWATQDHGQEGTREWVYKAIAWNAWLAACSSGPSREGWKLMPPEPTPEMLEADYKAACWYVIGEGVPQELKDSEHGQALACYRAVFAAAPSLDATREKP
jgi:hypothetical protein